MASNKSSKTMSVAAAKATAIVMAMAVAAAVAVKTTVMAAAAAKETAMAAAAQQWWQQRWRRWRWPAVAAAWCGVMAAVTTVAAGVAVAVARRQ